MNSLFSFIVGLVFGVVLTVSGMTNPAKVLSFLDVAGNWDPSLALVMGGAIPVSAVAFWLSGKRKTSLLGQPIQLPDTHRLDRRLVIGSALFGIGWGLAGIGPGPGITLLGYGAWQGLVFVAALLVGMILFEIMERYRTSTETWHYGEGTLTAIAIERVKPCRESATMAGLAFFRLNDSHGSLADHSIRERLF